MFKSGTISAIIGLFLITFSLINGQTITSKTTGGNWEDGNTWVGGVVPGQNNNVVIAGTVSVTGFSPTCNDLTVNTGAVLQNGGGLGWVTLYVRGSVINNGSIRNNPAGNSFYIEVLRDIVQNGSWTLSGTYCPGKYTQYITAGSGKTFDSEFFKKYATGYCDTNELIAKSNLTFTKLLQLDGSNINGGGGYWSTLNMSGYTLYLSSDAVARYGYIKNASVINMTGSAYLINIRIKGNTTLEGTVPIFDSNVYFENDLTVSGILQNGGGLGWVTLNVYGKLTNNGTIRNNPDGNELWIEARGDIANNGIWENKGLNVPGKVKQYISQTTGKYFNCEFIKKYTTGYTDTSEITAASDLTFRKIVQFDGSSVHDSKGYWSTLNMSGYTLNLTADANFRYGYIKNASALNLTGSAYLVNCRIRGNTQLQGTVPIYDSNIIFENDVTVQGILQNGGGYGWVTLYVIGKLTNNGTIRNNPAGNELWIEAQGDIVNNGLWQNKGLYAPGKVRQYISQSSGKFFDCEFFKRFAAGYTDTMEITAKSDLTFKKIVQLDATNVHNGKNHWSTLNMSGFSLNLTGDSNIRYGYIKDAANLNLTGNAYMINLVIKGNTTLRGRVNINDSNVYFENDVTVADTLQNAGGYGWVTLAIEGKLTNNGVIRNNPGGNELWIEAYGDIVNNGLWKNKGLYIPGKRKQYISQASGKFFDTEVFKKYSSGYCDTNEVAAKSDLTFSKIVQLDGTVRNVGGFWGRLNMAGYTLNLAGESNVRYGFVRDAKNLNMTGNSYLVNVRFQGNITLRGKVPVHDSNVIFENDITVADTLQNGGGYGWVNPKVYGSLINNGIIRNNPAGNELNLEVYGSIYNVGKWTSQAYLYTNGKNCEVSGTFDGNLYLEKSGSPAAGQVQAAGLLRTKGSLRLNNGIVFEIPQGSQYHQTGSLTNFGSIINKGSFSQLFRGFGNNVWLPADAGLGAEVRMIDRKTCDSLKVTSVSTTVHPKMYSSVKRYWKMEPNKPLGSYYLKLSYTDELLNGNREGNLEAYITADSGKTWKKISTPVNTTRDTVKNIITVGSDTYPVAQGGGDIILSSGDIVAGYSVSCSIGGRKQIRVGPPNIYTVSYWNNTNMPADKFFIVMNTNRGVHIKSVITKKIGTNERVEIPLDSLAYNDRPDEVVLLVQGLAPKEVRSFDVVLTAVPDPSGLKKVMEPITFTAVALWLGGAILEEYISNTVVEGCYEVWRPVRHDESLTEATKKAIGNSINKAVTVENGAKGVFKKGVEEVVQKTGKAVIWPLSLAKDAFDCLGNTIKGMKDYLNGNFDKNEKELEKVTSWDPNAKEGPTGYGSKGFIASSAPMTYTIFFENKKEATAPAWKIVIYDTLDTSVFDAATVKFGAMSHSMGTYERKENILTWEFVNIELPPNKVPPEGEGWVKFTVNPKAGLPTGTAIKNMATIIFDLNKPLATNVAVNTLDLEAPETTPLSVVKVPGKNQVDISWTINDKTGSGGRSSQVFMSADSAPFTIAAVSDSGKARINVAPGIKYRFYVLSKDNVGNAEVSSSKYLDIVTGMEKEEDESLPEEFALEQNYPNPFNPVTQIKFALAKEGRTTLKIYNLLGQEVQTLIDKEMMPGRYNVSFDASHLSSGIYIYRLIQNNDLQSKKMMLIK